MNVVVDRYAHAMFAHRLMFVIPVFWEMNESWWSLLSYSSLLSLLNLLISPLTHLAPTPTGLLFHVGWLDTFPTHDCMWENLGKYYHRSSKGDRKLIICIL